MVLVSKFLTVPVVTPSVNGSDNREPLGSPSGFRVSAPISPE